MTPDEWNRCIEPRQMVEHFRGNASSRKWWLFVAACCPSANPPLREVLAGAVALICEHLADGLATLGERQAAWEVLQQEKERFVNDHDFEPAAHLLAFQVVLTGGWRPSYRLHAQEANRAQLQAALAGAEERGYRAAEWARFLPKTQQCDALRELFPGPLSHWRLDPAWLTRDVFHLAQAAYERRLPSGHLDSARLSILADALEEAGCADGDLLGHLRGEGPHWRGCFAVDAVMGKS